MASAKMADDAAAGLLLTPCLPKKLHDTLNATQQQKCHAWLLALALSALFFVLIAVANLPGEQLQLPAAAWATV